MAVYSSGSCLRPAKPSSIPCQNATSASPTRQQSSTSSPPRLAARAAVTLDASGTLVGLVDRVPKLDGVRGERGVERPAEAIRRAFEAEGRVYATRAAEAHEAAAFATLQRECTGVFLAELD